MKKLVYLSAALLFSVTLASASTGEAKKDLSKTVVKIEKITEKKVDGAVLFTTYRGRCLDGTTFTFEADNLDEAQGYVNGYCAGLRANE